MPNNLLDWVIIALLVLGTLRGYIRGVVLELLGLAAWVAAYFAARAWSYPLTVFFASDRNPPSLYTFIAFAAIFILIMFGVNILASHLKRMTQRIGAGSADHALGTLAGCLKTFLLIVVACALLHTTSLGKTTLWRQSMAIAYLQPFFHLVPIPKDWVPTKIQPEWLQ